MGLLQFAEDLLVFISARKKLARGVRVILETFVEEAGQSINANKSTFMFSEGTPGSKVGEVKHVLNITTIAEKIRYLGSTISINPRCRDDYISIIQRMEQKLQTWKGSLISLAGRCILIQFVISSIPQYWIGHQVLPEKVQKKIIQI